MDQVFNQDSTQFIYKLPPSDMLVKNLTMKCIEIFPRK